MILGRTGFENRQDWIARLRDEISPDAQKGMGEWMAAHGALLQVG
jgi:hypothetical protein